MERIEVQSDDLPVPQVVKEIREVVVIPARQEVEEADFKGFFFQGQVLAAFCDTVKCCRQQPPLLHSLHSATHTNDKERFHQE